MARKRKGAPPAEPDTEAAATEAPQIYPEGFRTFLYHESAPQGRLFVGQEANEALAAGWVDHPSKV